MKTGEITLQQYQIERDRLTTEWQQWNAGIVTDTYGDPHLNFEGEDLPDIANANAAYTKRNADANLASVEAYIKNQAKQYIIDTLHNKERITDEQALYMFDHALRESIARKYEEATNLPWSQKDLLVHMFEGVLDSFKKVADNSDGFGDALANAIFDYLGIPRPRKHDKPSRETKRAARNQPGAGGKF